MLRIITILLLFLNFYSRARNGTFRPAAASRRGGVTETEATGFAIFFSQPLTRRHIRFYTVSTCYYYYFIAEHNASYDVYDVPTSV